MAHGSHRSSGSAVGRSALLFALFTLLLQIPFSIQRACSETGEQDSMKSNSSYIEIY